MRLGFDLGKAGRGEDLATTETVASGSHLAGMPALAVCVSQEHTNKICHTVMACHSCYERIYKEGQVERKIAPLVLPSIRPDRRASHTRRPPCSVWD